MSTNAPNSVPPSAQPRRQRWRILGVLATCTTIALAALWSVLSPPAVAYSVMGNDGSQALLEATAPVLATRGLMDDVQAVPLGQTHPAYERKHPMYPMPLQYADKTGKEPLNSKTLAGHRVVRVSFEATWGKALFIEVAIRPDNTATATVITFKGQGGYLRSDADWEFEEQTKPLTLAQAEQLFDSMQAQKFMHLNSEKELLALDGTSASIEMVDQDRYHVIGRQLFDERPRIRLLLNAIWETALDKPLSASGRMVLVMKNDEWRPIMTGGRFAALSLSNQQQHDDYSKPAPAPNYQIIFLDNQEVIRGTMVTDKSGVTLQPDGLDLRFEWSTRGKDAGYLYMKQPDGAGAGKHYQAWCIETYPTVEDIPKDLRTIDWWVNTYQRIAVEKNGE